MAVQDSTKLQRCTNEIPLSSNSAACDAVICNAPADVECEEGFRCWSCYNLYGGIPVSSAQVIEPKPAARVDFGLTMCDAIDRIFSEPDAYEKQRWATHRQLSGSDPLAGKGLL